MFCLRLIAHPRPDSEVFGRYVVHSSTAGSRPTLGGGLYLNRR
jgi:hypothetical protein